MPTRRRYTEALLADVRRRYEQTDERLADMAADMNLHRSTLQRMAQDRGWVRYAPPPCDLPEVAKLRRRAEALAAKMARATSPPAQALDRHPEVRAQRASKDDSPGGSSCSPSSFEGGFQPPPQDDGDRGGFPPPPQDGGDSRSASAEASLTPTPTLPLSGGGSRENAASLAGGGEKNATGAGADALPAGAEPEASPQQIARQVEQMLREVQGQLDGLTALRRQNAAAMTHSEITAASRAVNTLAGTLRDLQHMRGAPAAPIIAPSGDHHDDDMPRDIDEFRRDLAQRIAAIMESWDEEEPDEEEKDGEDAEAAAASAAAASDPA